MRKRGRARTNPFEPDRRRESQHDQRIAKARQADEGRWESLERHPARRGALVRRPAQDLASPARLRPVRALADAPSRTRQDVGIAGQILIASNRGPVTFAREDGELVPRRGGGGLVTALTGALHRAGGLWIASSMSDEDREQSTRGRISVEGPDAGMDLRFLSFDEDTYDR